MNEKRLPPRLMVLLVVLKGEKVYKIPLESGIKLDHLKEFNYKRGSIFANSPITLIIERQSNSLPFLAYTHPQPP